MNISSNPKKYSPALRFFALTLQFYSAKAYNYVRKTFNKCLPHPSTIQKWFRSLDASPGFTEEALRALKIKSQEAKEANKEVLCSLIVDEIAIRWHVEWDGNKFSGYVDYGTSVENDELPVAKEALTFMLNCINGNWKIPIAYFLIDGLNANERANLIKKALSLASESNVRIVSLTFDGTSTNLATVKVLGAKIEIHNLKPYFDHPTSGNKVVIFPDPSHMIKLIRNALASFGSVWHPDGYVDWNYIIKLEKLQSEEGLLLGTKLKKRHIEWQREKMKVKLATQALSASVADAIEYLNLDLQHPDFKNSEATVKFLRLFNNLFDIMNSKNLLSKGYKTPLQSSNEAFLSHFLEEAEIYIENLKTSPAGIPILECNRKTGFLGFLICISSVCELYKEVVKCPNPKMSFLLTYKLSQDHLEMFFSAIRSLGGYNNNPTAKQFQAAYKRLLSHHQIMTCDSANCIILDDTTILNVSSAVNYHAIKINKDNASTSFEDKIIDTAADEPVILNKFICDVTSYIAGFVAKKLLNTFHCTDCVLSIISKENTSDLISRKNRGGLTNPSKDLIKICQIAETQFRIFQACGKIKENNVLNKLVSNCLREVPSKAPNIFSSIVVHSFDQFPMENHRILLLKSIIFEFCKIRLNHLAKTLTEQFQKNKCRSKYTKLTLFKGQ